MIHIPYCSWVIPRENVAPPPIVQFAIRIVLKVIAEDLDLAAGHVHDSGLNGNCPDSWCVSYRMSATVPISGSSSRTVQAMSSHRG